MKTDDNFSNQIEIEKKEFNLHTNVEYTLEEVNKLTWKLDVNLIPYLGLLYLFSFLDRVNIGNAKLAGIITDLKVSANDYNWALSIFFFGYIIFEIPSNLMLKKLGAHRWIPIVMIAWGIVMITMATVKNTTGLLVARFFLGITEAGLFPGVIFYLSLWYTREEQASRIAWFFACATIAGAFGGVLAYGIVQMDGLSGLHGWQWIFILEGIPTVILAFISYFVLPDFPETCKFLNKREQEIEISRLKKDTGTVFEKQFSWVQFKAAFTDWKVYFHMIIYICSAIPLYSLSLFLPSIINGFGFSSLNSQALTAPPYAMACIFTILCAWHADKRQERGLHIVFSNIIAIIGYVLLIVLRHYGPGASYAASIITTTGVFGSTGPMISWFTNNIGGNTKRATATAIIISFGNIGGAIGGQIYRTSDSINGYPIGHTICACLIAFSLLSSLLLKYLLHRENKRRDKLSLEGFENNSKSEDLSDLHPSFRYIT
jgi:MFS family permease